MTKKVCTKCLINKSIEEFYMQNTKWGPRRQSHCKECMRTHQSEWAKNNRDKVLVNLRRSQLKKKYGISVENYLEMLNGQQGLCAICGRSDEKNLSVDHNHTTGKVRGLLCNNCNVMLGYSKDSIETLSKAIEYLDNNK